MRRTSPFHGYGCNGKGILHIRYNWPMFCWLWQAPMFRCCHIDGMPVLDIKQKSLILITGFDSCLPTQSMTHPLLVLIKLA